MPSWDWKASLIGLLLALAMTKIVGQQGTKSAWVLRATLHLSVPIGHWAHATRRLENLQGRSSAPRPAPSPLSKGRWTWGLLVAFGLPSQGLPSGGQVPGSLRFPGSLEGRPSFPGPLWPLLPPCGLPGQEASVHQGPALLSLAPLRPVSAAPLLGSWAPSLSSHLSVSHPPPSPNAACPSWGARCLPAACLPACSMPKLSACRLLERTNLPTWPGPCPWSPAGPWRGWVTWLPSPEGHRSSLGSCPGCIGPTSAGQVGGSQSLLARGQPSLTLKQNRRGSQKPGSLTHSLPSSALPLCGGGGPEPLPG